jgi:phosphocarrier protein HPr
MTERTVTIQNRAGIHARPAAMIVQTASKFKSKVFFVRGADRINGKSIMGILAMGATYDTVLRIEAEGEDEAEVVVALEKLFISRFESE